ncbi:MAG: hypothetical protein ACLPRE_06550 [Limisphaerales bacterium]
MKTFLKPADKAKHDRMVELVEQMLAARKQLAAAQNDKDKNFTPTAVTALPEKPRSSRRKFAPTHLSRFTSVAMVFRIGRRNIRPRFVHGCELLTV